MKWVRVDERLPGAESIGQQFLVWWVSDYDTWGGLPQHEEWYARGKWIGSEFADEDGEICEDWCATHWMVIKPPC